jgi:hypothetical protein
MATPQLPGSDLFGRTMPANRVVPVSFFKRAGGGNAAIHRAESILGREVPLPEVALTATHKEAESQLSDRERR